VKKASQKKTNKKRQHDARQLPFSDSSQSKAAGTAAPTSAKAKSKKRQAAKRAKQSPAASKRSDKETSRGKKRKRQLSIWFGPRRRLVVQLKQLKAKPKYGKVGRPSKKKLARLKRWRLAWTAAVMSLGLAGSVYFGIAALRPSAAVPVYSPPAPVATTPVAKSPGALPRSEPLHLRIPSVDIDTPLITVGRRADNTLQVPEPASVAGWYRDGPTPGETGPSVIVGHVNSSKGPAVFWRLGQIKPGDIIDVKRRDGKTTKFKVHAVKQFEQNNFPTHEVYGNIDHAGLRLITCGGNFNRLTGQYSHNTVVYASLVK
jgi:LPXTG-site transpeptidase (sortase) family protein